MTYTVSSGTLNPTILYHTIVFVVVVQHLLVNCTVKSCAVYCNLLDLLMWLAVYCACAAIPLTEPRTEPAIYFFDVVGTVNTIFHLFEKLFTDSLVPLVRWAVCSQLCAGCVHYSYHAGSGSLS